MRKYVTRFLAVTLAAAIALPVISVGSASAASPTEFSSRARIYRHHHGNAAALGAVATIFGTVAALAAASQYRDRHYYEPYGYYQPYGAYGYPYGGYYNYR
jgi:hypothetical protein